MPEGDNVFQTARKLAAIVGREIVRSDFRLPSLATADISGATFTDVASYGKHLLFRTDSELTVHSHLRMEGAWELYGEGRRWTAPAHEARVVLDVPPWQAVGFRMHGVEILPTSREGSLLGHLGPDVLGPGWDPEKALVRLLEQPTAEIGVALIDQRVMAGPGNVYKSEVLFLRGVHPRRAVCDVRDPAALVSLVKRLMDANRTSSVRVTTGDRRPGRSLWVYGRGGKPCRRCGTAIEWLEQGGEARERITYLCPSCQR